MKNTESKSRLLGKAAEHRVMAELLLRDIVPCIPAIDTTYDLVTVDGVRLQIKATRLVVKPRWKTPVYWFNLTWHRTKGRRRKDGTREYLQHPRNFIQECDFVILWGCDQDRFWIVPSKLLDGRSTVVVGPDFTQRSKMNLTFGKLAEDVRACENRWDLIEQFARTVSEPAYDPQAPIEVNKEEFFRP